MATTTPLPETHKALLFTSPSVPPTVASVPTPQALPGTVIVAPLYAGIVQYANEIFTNGNPRGYKYPLPFVPGGAGISRVAAVPPDAVALRPGQLVYVDITVRARDDPTAKILQGYNEGAGPATRKLMREQWRAGGWAQYAAVPAENVHALSEDLLVGKLGYRPEELVFINQLLVPYGGLSDIGLRPGETVLIAPATGSFGGAAVHVALAMGARVIAMGRNEATLAGLKALAPEEGRVETVRISGDVETDIRTLSQLGPIDVYLDFSPPTAGKSSHIKAGISALKAGGRISLMGGVSGDVEMPYFQIVYKDLTVRGTFMAKAWQVEELIRMVERGVLKVGDRAGMKIAGKFRLDQWEDALRVAAENGGPGRATVFVPNQE